MGMDAIIEGVDLRFSQLLAEVTYELCPEIEEQLNKEAFLKLSRLQVGMIIGTMARRLDDFKIYENNTLSQEFLPVQRVQYLLSNVQKLYTLLNWWEKKEEILTFA
jgi:hypothetical protein